MLNRWFTAIVAGVGGIGGSTISFLVSGAFIAALIGLGRKEYSFARERGVHAVAAVFAAFVAGEFILALLHPDDGRNIAFAATRLSFLGFLPLYSRLAVSEREQLMNALEWGSAAGAAAALALGVFQMNLDLARIYGGAGNPGPFSLVMLVMCTVTVSGYLRSGYDRRKRLVMAAGAAAAAACVLMSGMRTVWPGLILAPAILLWFNRSPGVTAKTAVRYLMATAIMAMIAIAAAYALMPERFTALAQDIDAVFNAGAYNNSLGQRLTMWSYGLDRFAESPVFGAGSSQLKDGLPEYGLSHFGTRFGYSHLHNAAIDAMGRGGLFALVLIVAVLLVPIVAAARHRHDAMSRAGFALMVAIVVDYMLAGTLNIMFGHDIQDFLFVFMMTVTACFVFGGTAGETRADPA